MKIEIKYIPTFRRSYDEFYSLIKDVKFNKELSVRKIESFLLKIEKGIPFNSVSLLRKVGEKNYVPANDTSYETLNFLFYYIYQSPTLFGINVFFDLKQEKTVAYHCNNGDTDFDYLVPLNYILGSGEMFSFKRKHHLLGGKLEEKYDSGIDALSNYFGRVRSQVLNINYFDEVNDEDIKLINL